MGCAPPVQKILDLKTLKGYPVTMSIPETYTTRQIPGAVGREFIRTHHYSRSCHNGPMTWGLFDGYRLVGVCAFATPGSENVRASVFGVEHKDRVTELHRLVILDETPKNTESWFISKALKGLSSYRPNLWAVLSFADESEGHRGTIYQATNALYLGETGRRRRFWRDPDGRLRHPRQSGKNLSARDAESLGWTAEYRDSKHRYLFLLGDGPRHRKFLKSKILFPTHPYPKG